jgi:hypothetical protein
MGIPRGAAHPTGRRKEKVMSKVERMELRMCRSCLCKRCRLFGSCGLCYCSGRGPGEFCDGKDGVQSCTTKALVDAQKEE